MKSSKPSFREPEFKAVSYAEAEISPPLPLSFYLAPTATVAAALLGKGLLVRHEGVVMLAEIVETEAYLGDQDPASHAFRGLSKRNWPMFESGGTCYVYLSYGINFCMNVVTGPPGQAEAVLLRAAIPRLGEEKIRALRGRLSGPSLALLNGPGKLTQGLTIDLGYNGATFDRPDFKLVDLGVTFRSHQIATGGRIGISKAKEEPLRFTVKASPWLSRRR